MRIPTDLERAYIAGILDGEGSHSGVPKDVMAKRMSCAAFLYALNEKGVPIE